MQLDEQIRLAYAKKCTEMNWTVSSCATATANH